MPKRPQLPSDTLTAKQQAFVDEYFAGGDFNQTAAAIRAGYASKNAKQQASALMRLPLVAAEIAKGMAELRKARGMSADEILMRMAEIARNPKTPIPQQVRTLHLLAEQARLMPSAKIPIEVSGTMSVGLIDALNRLPPPPAAESANPA